LMTKTAWFHRRLFVCVNYTFCFTEKKTETPIITKEVGMDDIDV